MRVDLSNQIVLRWDSEADCANLLAPGGIDAVWLQKSDESFAERCRAAGAQTLTADAIRLAGRDEDAPSGDLVAMMAGLWPGARATNRNADGSFSAGASQRAWIDANGYLVAWSKARYPERPPVLGYVADTDAGIDKGRVVSYESLELALIDAWTAGGNYILAPDKSYRDALQRGDPAAMAAWTQLGRMAHWLKENISLFRQPSLSAITVLVEPGEETAEIAALMFRHSGSPELVATQRVPAPDAGKRPIVVAAGIRPPSPEVRSLLLAHARAGATVFSDAAGDSPWWKTPELKPVRQFDDRAFYGLGAGRFVVYRDPVVDPGDFAQDVLDIAGDRRPVRLFDAPASIAMVSQAGGRARPVLRVVNYGSPTRSEIMAHVPGSYDSATLLRPGEASATLRTYRRGGKTEVILPSFRRLAVVVFG